MWVDDVDKKRDFISSVGWNCTGANPASHQDVIEVSRPWEVELQGQRRHLSQTA